MDNAYDISVEKGDGLLTTYLPSGDILLVCKVKDSFGAYANFTRNLSVSENSDLEGMIQRVGNSEDTEL